MVFLAVAHVSFGRSTKTFRFKSLMPLEIVKIQILVIGMKTAKFEL